MYPVLLNYSAFLISLAALPTISEHHGNLCDLTTYKWWIHRLLFLGGTNLWFYQNPPKTSVGMYINLENLYDFQWRWQKNWLYPVLLHYSAFLISIYVHCKLTMLADHCVLYQTGNNWNIVHYMLELDRNIFTVPCDSNRLTSILYNTKALIVGTLSKFKTLVAPRKLSFNGINRVTWGKMITGVRCPVIVLQLTPAGSCVCIFCSHQEDNPTHLTSQQRQPLLSEFYFWYQRVSSVEMRGKIWVRQTKPNTVGLG